MLDILYAVSDGDAIELGREMIATTTCALYYAEADARDASVFQACMGEDIATLKDHGLRHEAMACFGMSEAEFWAFDAAIAERRRELESEPIAALRPWDDWFDELVMFCDIEGEPPPSEAERVELLNNLHLADLDPADAFEALTEHRLDPL